MQRALGASGPTGSPAVKPQTSPCKVPGSELKEMPTFVQQDKSIGSTAVTKEVTHATTQKQGTPKVEAPVLIAVKQAETPHRDSVQETQILSRTELRQGQGEVVDHQQKPIGKSPQVQLSQTPKPEVRPGLAKEEIGKTPQQPAKSATFSEKSAPPAVHPAKQESGGFFGFGGPKTQPAAAKPAESVTGKMFGFGSSFLSSASTMITSAVQDEPKTTPPTPRKMSTTANESPRTTPVASPKLLPAKDTKPTAVKKTEEKQPEKRLQDKTPSNLQAKVDKGLPEASKVQTDIQGASKAVPTICPLCKVNLNVGSKDPPNYNNCTACKMDFCNQCGFNTMAIVAEVSQCLQVFATIKYNSLIYHVFLSNTVCTV